MDSKKATEVYCRQYRVRQVIKRIMQWDEGMTVPENAKTLGIKIHHAWSFQKRYALGFLRINNQNSRFTPQQIRRMRLMADGGNSFAQIGRAFATSRQNIRRILSNNS